MRTTSLSGRLARLGFQDLTRSIRLIEDPTVTRYFGDGVVDSALLTLFGDVADPDLALLTLVRLSEEIAGNSRLVATFEGMLTDDDGARRLITVMGASQALGDDLVRHAASLLPVLARNAPALEVPAAVVRDELLAAVGVPALDDSGEEGDLGVVAPVATLPFAQGVDALRRAYRTRLLQIAVADVNSANPQEVLPLVAAALADLASAALEGALALARGELPNAAASARISVLGMGKTGGRELNYVSDVDVIYVVEPHDGFTEEEALSDGTKLASLLVQACSGTFTEPALWPVDAGLRPEGNQGPLVRTLSSHLAYYERWAKTWEFQALLKARVVAGEVELGAAYYEAVQPLVWSAVTRENFVEDSQAMRRRVEDNVPAAEADRQIKLGKGGLRDVEFTVQLLQLVHGRGDESIRSGNTLSALESLASDGYVGRTDASRLANCYKFLRVLEHRLQLFGLRRTHLMPEGELEQRRLARSIGLRLDGPDGLLTRWRATKREVRALHEELFYRPILPAVAQLSHDEATLDPEAAKARLSAIGYRDPSGSMRHILALTEGLSRRAAIQRHLLPVMLGWFADGADPDRGLLAFRKLSDELGSAHWYLKLLRDSGSAAYRLARVLSNSELMSEALARSPESVKWLARDDELTPLTKARLDTEVAAILTRASEDQPAISVLRSVRRRELARTAVTELLGRSDVQQAQVAISDLTDATLMGALRVAEHIVCRDLQFISPPAKMLVIAMGRLGGREMGYGSDADLMIAFEPLDDGDGTPAKDYAQAVAVKLRTVLAGPDVEPPLDVDMALRPEGRNGPLVRSLASYIDYYARWAEPWERQALLRARPCAGDLDLGIRFMEAIDPIRYPADGIEQQVVREIRRIKARVEAERLPRGVEPARHLKLGPGSISDVEWTVQLLQLQFASRVSGLQTTDTLVALQAGVDAGLLTGDDAEMLRSSWLLCSRLRSAMVLWSGRVGGTSDVLPHDLRDLTGIAQVLNICDGSGAELLELYRRTTRQARAVVQRVFYEQ